MDYTLAQYQQPAFDQLAFDGAKEKLFSALGYPKEVLDFQYDHTVSFLTCDFIFLSLCLYKLSKNGLTNICLYLLLHLFKFWVRGLIIDTIRGNFL
jgi:hypothetical protein